MIERKMEMSVERDWKEKNRRKRENGNNTNR